MNIFLCGDVMTGRGIDQILPRPSEPALYEPLVTSALEYVEMAERASGPIPRPVDFAYIWGEALGELQARAPDLRLVNLETSITSSGEPLPKGINYHMHPANTPCLQAAGIDCCGLANNHVLDWGVPGLLETVKVLSDAGVAYAGAGNTVDEAARPAVLNTREGHRVLVFAFGSITSGIPTGWAATERRPGISLLSDLSQETARRVISHIRRYCQPRDIVTVSIHWGDNWGYEIPAAQRRFAHELIDAGVVDILHGHSSHHVKGIEVYHGRLVIYGCGDFINDYEGISGHENYRPDLVLAYFASIENESGRLQGLEMVPFCSRRFRLERARNEDGESVLRVLNREGESLGTSVELGRGGTLSLRW